MSGDQLEEAEVDRLGAAVFEQRRLSHMLRQRGAEIETLRSDRERLADRERRALERGEELRRRLREAAQKTASTEAERDRLQGELAEARQQREDARKEVMAVEAERGRLQRELEQVRYEARRADRRVAKIESAAGEDRKRAHLQRDALAAELRAGLEQYDEMRVEWQQALGERDEALEARDQARAAAAESVRGVEECALQLGQAQCDVELLAGQEKEREILLVDTERKLEQVRDHLRRVRDSRSWRWGHALAQALRTVTFRRRSGRSALDVAVDRLAVEDDAERAQDERRRA